MVKVCCFISMLIEDLEYQFLDKTIFLEWLYWSDACLGALRAKIIINLSFSSPNYDRVWKAKEGKPIFTKWDSRFERETPENFWRFFVKESVFP